MTYLRPNNRSNRLKPVMVALVVLGAIIALVQFAAPHFIPALVTSISSPFWRAEFSIEGGSLASREGLLNDNERLRRELFDAEVKLENVRSLQKENEELKAMLGRASTSPSILAAVLKRPPFAAYDELIIDLGSDDGIAPNQKVYAPGNVLIGHVIDVLGKTSKVRLLSSPGTQYEVLVGEARVPAVSYGRGGGQYLAQLPSDVNVADGDFIDAPSLNDAVFGIVTAVVSDPTQPFKTILFAPPVNVYNLRWVLLDITQKSQ